MNVLVYLLPMALVIGVGALGVFLWTLKSGQYDDLDGAAVRILTDDDLPLDQRSHDSAERNQDGRR